MLGGGGGGEARGGGGEARGGGGEAGRGVERGGRKGDGRHYKEQLRLPFKLEAVCSRA